MFENFDFSWFMTTPGILTCLGCLLIVISIIIFISSMIGDKKNKNENVSVSGENAVSSVNQVVTPVVPVEASNVTPTETVVTQTVSVTPVEVSDVAPVETVVTQTVPVTPVEASNVAPAETVVTQTVPVTPVDVSNVAPAETVVTQSAPVTQASPIEINPVDNSAVINQGTISQEPIEIRPSTVSTSTNSINTQTVSTANTNGFNGINIEPTIKPVNIEQTNANQSVNSQQVEPKIIYGGADPLAGTGVISTVSSNVTQNKEEIESL